MPPTGSLVERMTALQKAADEIGPVDPIGGMEGIFDEVRLFRDYNPTAKVLPVPATGAAAAIEYIEGKYPRDLANEISFASLFRRNLL